MKPIQKAQYQTILKNVITLYERTQTTVVEMYWQVGKWIVEVEQEGEPAARYGEYLILRLSKDLVKRCGRGFSKRNLERMRQFFLQNPIAPATAQLTWTHHVELLRIADPRVRSSISRRALKENLTSKEVRAIVFSQEEPRPVPLTRPGPPAKRPPLPRPRDLTLHTFAKVIDKDRTLPAGTMLIDCGFYVYRHLPVKTRITLAAKPSYTYPAFVERVVDGDTLWAVIDVGFGTEVREKLRLRGIDTPELGTREGESAKRHVVKLLPKGTPIVIKTYRNDRYGRFVADVLFCPDNDKAAHDPAVIIQGGIFLNAHLLDKGLAARAE
ncbi:MAG: thermonuclease family protein [Candidatus Omnitrophica bacterium]|nr:thermonuclease family protein [Candidatus Omnitrophota bacterium]